MTTDNANRTRVPARPVRRPVPRDSMISAAALALFALFTLPGPAFAQTAQPALTPEQKAKIEAAKKKAATQAPAAAKPQPAPAKTIVKTPPQAPPPAAARTAAPPRYVPKPKAPPTAVAPPPAAKPAIVKTPIVKPVVKPVVVKSPVAPPPSTAKQVAPAKTYVPVPKSNTTAVPATTTATPPPNARVPDDRRVKRYEPRPAGGTGKPPAVVTQPGVPAAKQPPPRTTYQPDPNRRANPQPIATPGSAAQTMPRVVPPAPANLEALKAQRQEIVTKRTNAKVIKEPDNRMIVKRDNRAMIMKDESQRLQRVAPGAKVEAQKDGTNVTVIERPNNVTIYNITDNNGQLVRRYRRDADGREHDIIDNRRKKNRWRRNLAIGLGVGAGVVAGAAILNAMVDVPPPRVDVPRRKYVVDYDDAGEEEVYEAFSAPPVDRIERRYTLDEVRATPRLRERMRRVDLNDITFDTGSWEVAEGQYHKLERAARALLRVIERNPNEVFMIEGYTDAVGSEDDNLSLSDRRAESVAVILTEQFGVPPENITTQGYGEQYLKIETDGPERANRRVAVRRITPLISQEGSPQDDGPPPPPN